MLVSENNNDSPVPSVEHVLLASHESEDAMMMWGYDPGWGGWLMMGVSNLLWLVLLALLVWVVIRWFERWPSASRPDGSGTPVRGPSALEILNQRYARGEIDTATFEQMRERLQATDTQRMLHESRP